MSLEKLLPDTVENKHFEKLNAKEDYKKIDKQSLKVVDLAKRIELLEKILGLE